MRYDVVIIGAGAAGFACALTLGSANDKFDWAKDKKYIILDDNKSDLNVGKYFNVAGVESGINGVDLLSTPAKIKTFLCICFIAQMIDFWI